MLYDLKKLEQMTLEEVIEIAHSLGLKPQKRHTQKMIIYSILDAQADQRAVEVQAREDARAERQLEKGNKRERVRVKQQPQKVHTVDMNNTTATVGSVETTMSEIKEEHAKVPHKKNKTVQAIEARKPLQQIEGQIAENKEVSAEPAKGVATTEPAVATEPTEEVKPKKRGRKKKNV